MLRTTTLTLAVLLAAGPAFAQTATGTHTGHAAAPAAQTRGRAAVPDTEATRAFRAINDRMHRDMAVRFTGNPDRDFAQAMIPHHQGAIDMARVVLQHGRDPEIRRLAEDVIRAQEAEIAQLRAYLARNPG